MAYDLGTAHGKIELEYTGRKEADAAQRDMDKLKDKSKDTDKSLRILGASLKGLGKGVAIGGLAVGLANAGVAAADLAIQVAGVVPQLVSIGSLAAALPAMIVGVAASVGVMKAAFAGVGDAVGAAFDTEHPEKFDKAIKNLSPSAQAFAKAVQASSADLRKFQQGLQESFFSASTLTAQFGKAQGALQTLGPNLKGIAGDFGELTRRVANFALSRDSIEFVNSSLTTFRSALKDAAPALIPILAGLRDVGTVGQTLMRNLGAAVGETGTRFGEFLSRISADGTLEGWINTAISTLGTLGTIAKNVGSILGTIFQTANATGGGLLNTIAQITGQFKTFLDSAQGSAAITSLFTSIGTVAKQLAPVFTTLVGALAGALGPALADLATGVGPQLLAMVQALAPSFGPLAQAVADVAVALAPLLPYVAQFVGLLAQLAAGSLSSLAGALGPVISMLGGTFASALQTLAPLLLQLAATVLPMAAEAGLQLAQALAPLMPSILAFAQALASSLLPVLPQLVANFQQLLPVVLQVATLLGQGLMQALTAITPLLPTIVAAFTTFIGILTTFVTTGLLVVAAVMRLGQIFSQLPGLVMGALTAFAGMITGAMTTAKNAISTGITAAIGFFTALPGRIGSAIAALPGVIGNIISNAMHTLAYAFGAGIGIAVTLAVTLPQRVLGAIASLPGVLGGLASRAWAALRAAFSSGVAAAANLARTLPGRVRSGISSLGGLIAGVARAAWASLKSAFSSGVSQATSIAASLPGRIRGAIGSLAGMMAGAGRDAVAGLVNGIRAGVGAAASAAASLGASVMSGIRSTLRIGSPSKEMVRIGQFVTQGLRNGLLGTAKQVQAASNKLANMVRDAFSDKLIRKGTRNSILKTLSTGTKQLVGLVSRANATAAKLKAAQANLAAVQKQYDDTKNNAIKQTKDTFNVVSPGQQFVDLNLTKDRFRAAVTQAKDFAKNIATLTKKGLSKDLIQQLVDAGAADGGAMAKALANSSAATIKEFNGLQGQLNGAANAVGKTTADALYGAGLNAAKGLVKGLQSQQKAIEAQMVKIANSMVKAIKKALKIKSPSRVMFDLGQFTSEGMADGINSLRKQVEQAAQRLATASIIPTVRLTTATAANGAQKAATASSVAGGTVNNFNQTVNALPGMSAKQVADYGLTKLTLAITTGVGSVTTPAPANQGA
jgi:phage-related protein